MKLFQNVDKETTVNVWLLTLISMLPFVAYYSFLRIRKLRKITLINIIALGGFIGYVIGSQSDFQHSLLLQYFNYGFLPGIDAIFVYKWSKEWNVRILSTTSI